ncbi:SDR family NAD(P)-dependent oxidoreductase [Croceicoccus ponticola]|nr:SDR family oxidoreductase [Croceicoccus ponticola]
MSDDVVARHCDRVVIVTGAASGIGAASVAALVKAGAKVVAIDLNEVSQPATHVIRMSVSDEAAWISAIAETTERFGRIDGLVNCAGIIRMGPITEMDLGDFRLSMQVNVEGPFLGMKHTLPVMYRQGSGSVVNISSTAGIAGAAGASAYCASKAAVRLMSKAAALEAIGGGTRVRVNSVHPAMTETPMVKEIVAQLGGDEEIEKQMRALQPSGQFIPVSAVVDAILFLLSDAAAYVNGTEFVVDNGFTAQ